MDTDPKPQVIYDGGCRFCRRWIAYWQSLTEGRVTYAPFQEEGDRFPDIPREALETAVQLVEVDGKVYSGAEAVFRTLRYAPGRRWLWSAYRWVPGLGPTSRVGYRFVARHRRGFSLLTDLLWGSHLGPPTHYLTRWFFLRMLAVVYLIAFVSLGVQVIGLVGENGISPVARRLDWLESRLGDDALSRVPTLCWFDASDASLKAQCTAGAVLSLVLMFGIAPVPVLALLWVLYLSLQQAGGVFLSFQWDILLLEAGFLAVFLAPLRLWPRLSKERPPSRIVIWLLCWLVFRLMFESGAVKLTQDNPSDPTWHQLTALNYHYETQPIPTWTSWYAHHLPEWFQKASLVVMFGIELLAPFLIFGPRRLRMFACCSIVGFMILIGATGNFTYFNLLTAVLCIALLDDAFLRRFVPKRSVSFLAEPRPTWRWPWARTILMLLLAAFIVPMSALAGIHGTWRDVELPKSGQSLLRSVGPFHFVNSYGLFREMTTTRPEIIIEGSTDGSTWLPYEFRYKPGDTSRPPRFVQPHQPRLDWQMWFAALSNFRHTPWFRSLMGRVLEGSPEVLALFETNPFPDAPPRYVRATMYDYHFTDAETRRATGAWWRRDHRRAYSPTLQRRR